MSSTYLYSVNKVLNIDNAPKLETSQITDNNEITGYVSQFAKRTVVCSDPVLVEENLNDNWGIDQQLRIIGGTWTDEMVVQNIYCHSDGTDGRNKESTNNNGVRDGTLSHKYRDRDNAQTIVNGQLNVALKQNELNLNGKIVNISSGQDGDSETTIKGKTVVIGENRGNTFGNVHQHTESVLSTTSYDNSRDFSDVTNNQSQQLTNLYPTTSWGVQNDGTNFSESSNLEDTTLTKTILYGQKIEFGTAETTQNINLNCENFTINLTNSDARDITNYDGKGAYLNIEKNTGYKTDFVTSSNNHPILTNRHVLDKTKFEGSSDYVDEPYSTQANLANSGSKDLTSRGDNENQRGWIEIGNKYNTNDVDIEGQFVKIEANRKLQLGTYTENTDTEVLGKRIIIGENTSYNSKNSIDGYHSYEDKRYNIENLAWSQDDAVTHQAAIGERLNVNEKTRLNLFSQDISIGDTVNTDTVKIYTEVFEINCATADGTRLDNTSGAATDNSGGGAYFRIEKNTGTISDSSGVGDTGNDMATITLGEYTHTNSINLSARNINLSAQDDLGFKTESFAFNKPEYDETNTLIKNPPCLFELDNTANKVGNSWNNIDSGAGWNDPDGRFGKITLGTKDRLKELNIYGRDITIGESNCTINLLGNIKAWSEGTQIITNTVVEETSAFMIHNTGTKTALTVLQDNNTPHGDHNLVEFFTKENQDKTPFRIDYAGRVGLGVKTHIDTSLLGDSLNADDNKYHLKAWLHINRNGPSKDTHEYDNVGGYDMFLVEDENEEDSTPFIIKKEGDVGIGTREPRYKLDVWSTKSQLNGQKNANGDWGSKGIALRDVVYIKQNFTNRIFFGFTNIYDHTQSSLSGRLPDTELNKWYYTGYDFSFNNYAHNDSTSFDTSYATFPHANGSTINSNNLGYSNLTRTENWGSLFTDRNGDDNAYNIDTTFKSVANSVDPWTTTHNGSASDIKSYIIRMTCKIHIADDLGNIAFRRFEIFIDPSKTGSRTDKYAGGQYDISSRDCPCHVTVADLFDSEYEHYKFGDISVERQAPDKFRLKMPWKIQKTSLMDTTDPKVHRSRAYVDVEYFGHEYLGDIKAEVVSNETAITAGDDNYYS
jgi:hypothetical protein